MNRLALRLIISLSIVGLVAADEPNVLFEDTFDGQLGDGWTWLREDPVNWRLENGALEIRVEQGKANTVKNALVRKAPDRSKTDFAVELTVTFTENPTEQYEQGGITWYRNGQPVFKLVHEHIDGEDWIIPGRKPAASKTIELRLVVEGTRWTAQFRKQGEGDYQTAASGELPPPGEDQISIQCYEGPADAAHWIQFDNFRIVELQK